MSDHRLVTWGTRTHAAGVHGWGRGGGGATSRQTICLLHFNAKKKVCFQGNKLHPRNQCDDMVTGSTYRCSNVQGCSYTSSLHIIHRQFRWYGFCCVSCHNVRWRRAYHKVRCDGNQLLIVRLGKVRTKCSVKVRNISQAWAHILVNIFPRL